MFMKAPQDFVASLSINQHGERLTGYSICVYI